MRRGVMRGGSLTLLRSRGKAGVRAAIVKIGRSAVGGASAWIVGGARAFCWLLARRSATQKEVAADGQVCAAGCLADGSIE